MITFQNIIISGHCNAHPVCFLGGRKRISKCYLSVFITWQSYVVFCLSRKENIQKRTLVWIFQSDGCSLRETLGASAS